MKRPLLSVFFLIPCTAFAYLPHQEVKEIANLPHPYSKDSTLIEKHSNLEQVLNGSLTLDRTVDFPTHVVRMTREIEKLQLKCETVQAEINSFFLSKISSTKFFYNTIIFCGYNRKTDLAVRFSIFTYFDPLDDGAVEYAKNFISELNGKDFLGAPFVIEAASNLVVALNVDAGLAQDEYGSVLLRYQHDNENYVYPHNYAMIKEMVTDIYARFYSNDPKIVLPFFEKWFHYRADLIYKRVLAKSNYVLLQPERMFLMSKEPHAFTSPLRMYFGHKCEKYKNKMCL